MTPSRALRIVASLLPVCVFLAVYLPRVGHGFILDDYGWIFDSRVSSLSDLRDLFVRNNGFYRPVVSLTFAIDHALFGLAPLWYGLTNVALAVTCAALLYVLARAVGLPWGAAALAGSLWLVNFHGISMAVLWISGRTSLLLTGAALAAAVCIARRRLLPGAIFTAIALLSKEEAVALPIVLGGWIYILNRDDPARRSRMLSLWALCSLVLLAAYFGLRAHSGAMTPATAPHYYRFTFAPAPLGRNVLEYADRTFTLPILVVGISWLLLRRKGESDPAPSAVRLDLVACAGVWTLGAYALNRLRARPLQPLHLFPVGRRLSRRRRVVPGSLERVDRSREARRPEIRRCADPRRCSDSLQPHAQVGRSSRGVARDLERAPVPDARRRGGRDDCHPRRHDAPGERQVGVRQPGFSRLRADHRPTTPVLVRAAPRRRGGLALSDVHCQAAGVQEWRSRRVVAGIPLST